MAGMQHEAPYVDAPDFAEALPDIAVQLGTEAFWLITKRS